MLPAFGFHVGAGIGPVLDIERLLDQGPVVRQHEMWLALSWAAVRQVLSDPRFSRAAAVRRQAREVEYVAAMDPPRHSRIRRLLSIALRPELMDALGPATQRIVDDLLDDLAGHGQPADLVSSLARPLPVRTIRALLGAPSADSAPERITDLIAAKRATPDEALVSALINANDEGDRLTEPELVVSVQTLLVVGHETTAKAISNSLVTLLAHPDQADLVRTRPELLPRAIEELLRFSGPTMAGLPRVAVADVDLLGTGIAEGETVLPVIGVANRDPAVFTDPHRFDVTRTAPVPGTALGHGPHACLGADLARLELRTAVGTVLRRFPALKPAVDLAELGWRDELTSQTPSTLPATW